MLQSGKYETRNSRLVELFQSQQREKRAPAGTVSSGSDDVQMMTVWRGRLLKADGKSVDSEQEWEESNNPMMLGAWIKPGKAEGIHTEFDLIRYIGPVGQAA